MLFSLKLILFMVLQHLVRFETFFMRVQHDMFSSFNNIILSTVHNKKCPQIICVGTGFIGAINYVRNN